MIPTKKQWSKWSLPSKLTAIGAYVGVLGLILAALTFLPRKNQILYVDKPIQLDSLGEFGYMGHYGRYVTYQDSSNIELQIGGFLSTDCGTANACTRISIVSSGHSKYVIDSFFVKLHGYSKCDLRNLKQTTGAYSGSPIYEFYINEFYDKYEIVPVNKIGEKGSWRFTGEDFEEFFVKFYFDPYVLYLISFELIGRDLHTKSRFKRSSEVYPLIRVLAGYGDCLNLKLWYDPNNLILPRKQNYGEGLRLSEYQVLISDRHELENIISQITTEQKNQTVNKFKYQRGTNGMNEWLDEKIEIIKNPNYFYEQWLKVCNCGPNKTTPNNK